MQIRSKVYAVGIALTTGRRLNDVGMKSATLAKCDIRANDTVGTNVATFGDSGTLFDDGGGVYLAHYDDGLTTRRYR